MMMFRSDSRILVLSFVILSGQAVLLSERIAADETRTVDRPGLCAGASAIDVSSRSFPVLINGGFLQNSTTKVNAPLFAKCLVLDNGTTRLAIVIVDSFMMPRELLDRAKEMAREKTGIATDRMLIAATHAHSNRSSQHASGASEPRRDVSVRSRRSRPDRALGPDSRGPTGRGSGRLFAALLRLPAGLVRLLRQVRRGACPPDRRPEGEPAVRRHQLQSDRRSEEHTSELQ